MRKITVLALSLALSGLALSARAGDPTAVPSASLPEVDHMVYLSFLPEPAELMKDAEANGLTVLRLDRTADKVVVSYKYPDGHTATLGYALLTSARSSDRVVARVEAPSSSPEPEIVYIERERPYTTTRVVYRDRYDDFWLPLTLGLGIGYITGHNSHGHVYYRGYNHSRGYSHSRGWRH